MKNSTRFELYDCKKIEEIEEKILAPYAKNSSGTHSTRRFAEAEHDYRTAFQRDRDRIIHSRAFRRLKHKRQVFLTAESDHYRTRITHTLEVAQLARTMARALGLNEDLVEAIALGHDLGHTPFGHLGEVTLNQIMTGAKQFTGQVQALDLGGFKHNYQSVRIVDFLEMKYPFQGLNLTAPVREGILKHTRLRRGRLTYPGFCFDGLQFERDMASTLEGQLVATSDEIAQRTHDLEDGIRAGLVEIQDVTKIRLVKLVEEKLNISELKNENTLRYQGLLIRGLINHLVEDVINCTLENITKFSKSKGRLHDFDEEIVRFSANADPLQMELNEFIYEEIIDYSRVKWSDDLGEKLLFRLFEAYYLFPNLLPEYVLTRYFQEKNWSVEFKDRDENSKLLQMQRDAHFFRIICDHIAGMTDNFAVHEAQRLASLHRFNVQDLHLELALGEPQFQEE